MNHDLETRLDLLRDVTAKVGTFALLRFRSLAQIAIETKGEADYVSTVDREAESSPAGSFMHSSPPTPLSARSNLVMPKVTIG